jgi:hypothetical protein
MIGMLTDQIAALFGLPPEVARVWEREALVNRLRRGLWWALIMKHAADVEAELVSEFRLDYLLHGDGIDRHLAFDSRPIITRGLTR